MKFLEGKEYSYTTHTEEEFEKLLAAATREKYYDLAKEEFEKLETALHSKKNEDLLTHQDDIRLVLENEIVSRYYYQKGRVESNLFSDEVVSEAMEILKNRSKYEKLLSPV